MKKETPKIYQHIFISYSDSDRETAEKIINDLKNMNIPIWMDYVNLVVGTSDWETEIRKALENSFAILLLASPSSRKSIYIKGEIDIAQSIGRPIYPLWISGNEWVDCIPIGMTKAQYIDVRGKKYEKNIKLISKELLNLIDSLIPKHFLIKNRLKRIKESERAYRIQEVSIPPQCLSIDLFNDFNESIDNESIIIKPNQYSSILSLLDDVYLFYLSKIFLPYTYGKDWILAEFSDIINNYSRLLIPWSWLSLKSIQNYEFVIDFAMNTEPHECGLKPLSNWNILKTKDIIQKSGLAINEYRIYKAMMKSPKAEYFFLRDGFLKEVPLNYINVNEFKFLIPFTMQFRFIGDSLKDKALMQTNKAIPEKYLQYWLSS